MKNKTTLAEDGDNLVVDFVELESYEEFEVVAQKIIEISGGVIVTRIDGPESRIWDIIINGEKLALHNNPYGNYLKTNTEAGKAIAKFIFDKF